MPPLRQAHVQGFYRPLIVGFVVAAVVVIGGVVYASTGQTTIRVTPTLSSITTTFSLTIGPQAEGELALQGTVAAESLSTTITATPTTDGAKVPAHATGTVTISNTSGSAQPLAAGTRLQHENGTIVRTTTRLDVPAKGRVDTAVVADPLGEEGNLPPGHFLIVALRPANQALIYGDSTVAFTGGLTSAAGSLSLESLTAASNEGEQKLKEQFDPAKPGFFSTLLPVSVGVVPPATEPASTYAVTVTMKGLTATYDQAGLATMINERLTTTLKDGQEIASIETPIITFESQPTSESVVLKITATGLAQIRPDSDILDPAQFTNLDRADISKKLLNSDLVATVSIEMSPWWRSTTANDPAKITITRLTP